MSKALEEKKNDLITRAEEILNAAKAEERELTADEITEMTGIRDNVRKIEASMKLEEEFGEMTKKEDNIPKEEKRDMGEENKRSLEEQKELDRQIFADFIRGHVTNERAGEMEKGNNGAVIPQTIAREIIKKVYDMCPILDRSMKMNVKGTLQVPFYPADSDHITADYADEFNELASTTGNFDSVTLTGFLAGALTKVSRSLINNAQFDIVGFVVDEMAEQIRRFIEGELLHGTQSKVDGLSTLSNGITAASSSAITADEIVRLHDSIKDRFQQNACWIMSPATRTALRLLKSETGYYLLNDDISTPFGTSLLGKPVFVSDNMPDMATGECVIYYGDMRGLCTKFSEDINIQVLRERFATEHAVGVVGWFEFDAKIVDEQKLAGLWMA